MAENLFLVLCTVNFPDSNSARIAGCFSECKGVALGPAAPAIADQFFYEATPILGIISLYRPFTYTSGTLVMANTGTSTCAASGGSANQPVKFCISKALLWQQR